MATIKITDGSGVDLDDFVLHAAADGNVKTNSKTTWRVDLAGDSYDELTGKNFTYDGSKDLAGGTIAGLKVVDAKVTQFQVTGLVLDAMEYVNAKDGAAFLAKALENGDTITGGTGDDHLLGFAGNDTIDGGKGADTMAGGADNDTYILDSAGDSIVEGLTAGIDTAKLGLAAIGAFAHVENYIYTGKGEWTFTGNELANTITGGSGKDTLDGGKGNDSLLGGAGVDDLLGGEGDDRLDGGAGIDELAGGDGNDTYVLDNLAEAALIKDSSGTHDAIETKLLLKAVVSDIEDYTYTGSSAWTFTGTDAANILTGGKGIDTLSGGKDADTLIGNAGNDVLDGGEGADRLEGGLGNDIYKYDGSDTLVDTGGTDTVVSSVTVDLAKDAALKDVGLENVTLAPGATNLDATGNALKNILIGNAGDNRLDGGAENDTMTGGDGNDTYVIDSAGDKVTESGKLDTEDTVETSIAIKAAIANVENYQYTGTANWTFTGNALANDITGGSGNDTLAGGGGKDAFAGGGGDDTYTLDSLDDTVTEALNEGADTVKTTAAIAKAFDHVENYTFTGKGDWAFTGNDLANAITGGSGKDDLDGGKGNDTILGGAGIDTLTGGEGDDVLDGGAGNDTLDGGAGNDTYILDSTGDIVITDTDGANDTIQSKALIKVAAAGIESYAYTGTAAWTFTGDNLDNTLSGGSGADTLTGGKGKDILKGNASNDTLAGGEGDDTLIGGLGNDIYKYDGVGKDTIEESAKGGTDTVHASVDVDLEKDAAFAGQEIENVTLLTGALNATGNGLNNIILGNDGENRLDGGAGSDTMTGGWSDDSYIIDSQQDRIIELKDQGRDYVETSVLLSRLIANVENYTYTGSGNWNFTGDSTRNIITGGTGNDVIEGGGGDDILSGGASGVDLLRGGANDDIYVIDHATVRIEEGADSGLDRVFATISIKLSEIGGQHVEEVQLKGSQALSITGSSGVNRLVGNDGDNIISGGGGSDILIGNGGADVFTFTANEGSSGGRIDDFASGIDRLDLSALGAFSFIGADEFDGLGPEISAFHDATNNTTRVYADIDGDKDVDLAFQLSGQLTEGDFTASSIETGLTLTGDELPNALTGKGGDDRLSGLADSDTLTGNRGNDILDGGTGADTMTGGAGNDTYFVDDVRDIIAETNTPSGGVDSVIATASYSLSANTERLVLASGSAALTGEGNDRANSVVGNESDNIIDGGEGADTLTGDLGQDKFFFKQGQTGVAPGSRDLITDFNTGVDQIDLSGIDAKTGSNGTDSFNFIGGDAFTSQAGELRTIVDSDRDVTIVEGDTDGNGVADFVIELVGKININATDFTAPSLNASVSLIGDGKGNILWGSGLSDTLAGEGGDDSLRGGKGNDSLDGGEGSDTAVFSGKFSDYAIYYRDGGILIQDLNSADVDDGTDAIIGVERLQFTDRLISVASEDTVHGQEPAIEAGRSVASAGDINGDGYADIIIGAPGSDSEAGGAYVVLGTKYGLATSDLASLDGANGFRIVGTDAGGLFGYSVQSAGDVNGDGFDDVIIGAPFAEGEVAGAGAGYVIFGKDYGFSATIDLLTLNGSNGFKLLGAAVGDFTGRSVHSAGDFNQDGYADILIGADGSDAAGENAGRVYLVMGHGGTYSPTIDLSALDGVNGMPINGDNPFDRAGWSVSATFDFSKDRVPDLLIGAPGNAAVYIVYGGSGNPGLYTNLGPVFNGIPLYATKFNGTGSVVASAGDVDGDGLGDIVIGAPYGSQNGKYSGETYIWINDGLPRTGGTIYASPLTGERSYDYSGFSVASAGDINGDGYSDVIVGVPNAGQENAGGAYVLFGSQNFLRSWGNIDLQQLSGSQGFWIEGSVAGDGRGASVASAGDINGDGFDDLLVGAPAADAAGSSTGEVQILYGADFLGQSPRIGGAGADTMIGGGQYDRIMGLGGDDILRGGDGVDSLDGGSGNDIIVGGRGFDTVRGGRGSDTFVFAPGDAGDAKDVKITTAELFVDRIADFELGVDKIDLSSIDADVTNPGLDHFRLLNSSDFDGKPGAMNLLYNSALLNGHHTIIRADTDGDKQADIYIQLDGYLSIGRSDFTDDSLAPGPRSTFIVDDYDPDRGRWETGWALASGDVNNDGYSDVIVGAPRHTIGRGGLEGKTFVIYGGEAGLNPVVRLSKVDSSAGSEIWGAAPVSNLGFSVASRGDFNGDGIDDVLVGAPGTSSEQGLLTPDPDRGYVIFGSSKGLPEFTDLAKLQSSQGIALYGAGGSDWAGYSLAFIGDMNGDGVDDIVVGAPHSNTTGDLAGTAYVVFGRSGVSVGSIDLTNLDGTLGYKIEGLTSKDYLGTSVSSAGDMNGDGFADLVVGSDDKDNLGGTAYVLFGHTGSFSNIDLINLDGNQGFSISGLPSTPLASREIFAVSSAGDLNGDGFDDLAMGSVLAFDEVQTGGQQIFHGGVYVVFGHGGSFATDVNVAEIDGQNGFIIRGLAESGTGVSVSAAGDVNGDGYGDLLVGAGSTVIFKHGLNPGAWLLYGSADGFEPIVDLAEIGPEQGFFIGGEISYVSAWTDQMGRSVASGGDIDGDGYDDILIGAPLSSLGSPLNDPGSGAVQILYGGGTGVTKGGTNLADVIIGASTEDVIVGAQGDDYIEGKGGADSIRGGAGSDEIHILDAAFRRIDGGGGEDTLHLDFGGTIDFSNLDGDNFKSDGRKIISVEIVDVANGQANDLVLSLADARALEVKNTDVGDISTLDNVLRIDGEVGDLLRLSLDDGWGAANTTVLAGYALYTVNLVRIAVDVDIDVLFA